MQRRVEALRADPNPLAASYSRFRVGERLLFTGHSHQAWPDVAREAQVRAFDDAAAEVDRKWSSAFEQADAVKAGFARLLDGGTGAIAPSELVLAANTHELLIRFLSALPIRETPRFVTTDGEFHSIRRQLQRLEEEGVEIVRIAAEDPHTIADRLCRAIDDRTAAVLVSTVLFRSGRIVPGLDRVAEVARRHGVPLLVDTYHHLNVVPCDLHAAGLGDAWAVGGGYKYLQLGEGSCFLRVPPDENRRPVITGWFAEFEDLAAAPAGRVAYGRGAAAFVGATYDPTSHYRAAAVFDFFVRRELDPHLLRAISQHQVGRLANGFDALDLDPTVIARPAVALEELAGFLTLRTPRAEAIHAGLRMRGVRTDFRGDSLRFGPAPYLSDRQIDDAMAQLREVVRELERVS
ncbi:MAG: aminotransferase class V-fold PLP-dependent enzyme [Acidobacteriota bacterium]